MTVRSSAKNVRPDRRVEMQMAEQILEIPAFITVTLGFAVYLLGAEINARIAVLRQFNIPEPVTGGLLASLVVLALYLLFGMEMNFDLAARDFLLVVFFAGIGLNARLADLIAGGKPLLLLLVLTLATIVFQNVIGAAGAVTFGYPGQAGVRVRVIDWGARNSHRMGPGSDRSDRAGRSDGIGRRCCHAGSGPGSVSRRPNCAVSGRRSKPQPVAA